jgi:hypothetical protein
MAKTSAWGKAQRVLRFLLGLSNPRIAGAMTVHGFSEADLDEGWRLLRAVRPVRLDAVPLPVTERDPVERLFEWQRAWIPIARVALRRHYPKLHQRLFVRAFPSEGSVKVLMVDNFLRTLDGLERTAEGKNARALLVQRGLTRAVLADGRARVDEIKDARPRLAADPADERGDWGARETELWDWYLEWGSIASRKIKDRNLLRQLGFLASARSAQAAGEPLEPLDREPPPPAPAKRSKRVAS